MKKVVLFLSVVGLMFSFLGCSSKQSVKKKIEKKSVIDEQLLYEEFKSKKAQERLDKELN
jgi:uncharacterized protein YcfL